MIHIRIFLMAMCGLMILGTAILIYVYKLISIPIKWIRQRVAQKLIKERTLNLTNNG